MAAITSAQSGNWSATATWTGGVVPGLGDTVTIQNTHTVTIDQNITVGADTTTAAINVAAGGKFQVLNTVAGNYTLTLRGDLTVSGTLEIGTIASPIPSTRTFTIVLNDSAALVTGKYGMIIDTGGALTVQGASLTYDRALLAVDASAGQVLITTNISTTWKANDRIAIAATGYQYETETTTLSIDASGTTLTLTPGLSNAHTGTAPRQAEIINLTRNIKITASSSLAASFVRVETSATVDIDWCEFVGIGTSITGKRGLEIKTTTGSCNIQNSAIFQGDDLVVTIVGASVANITFSNNVAFFYPSTGFSGTPVSNTDAVSNASTITLNNNIFFVMGYNLGSGILGVTLNLISCIFTNNTVVGASSYGIKRNENGALGTFTGNTVHSSSGGIDIAGNAQNSTIGTPTLWYCGTGGAGIKFTGACANITIDTPTTSLTDDDAISIQNHIANLIISGGTISVPNGISESHYAVAVRGAYIAADILIQGTTFSLAAANAEAFLFTANAYVTVTINNAGSAYASAWGLANCVSGSFVKAQNLAKTAGSHETSYPYGRITRDTTIYRSASPSERLTPSSASTKLKSGSKKVAANSTQTATITVRVRESIAGDGTDYNGNRARLVLKRNDSVGVTSDTVLATATVASEGAWETLSAATPAASADGVFEVTVDCDGTTGWVNVDDWSAT